jgi:hypothetical protein
MLIWHETFLRALEPGWEPGCVMLVTTLQGTFWLKYRRNYLATILDVYE